MEEKILITPVDPITFEFQDYSIQDSDIITKFEIDTIFDSSTDYIEYFIYDENKNQIYPFSTQELSNYTVKNGDVLFSPNQDLSNLGFDEGIYYISYNFYKKRLNSSLSTKYFISEINSDRTEIRLDSTQISNEDIISSTNEFIEYRNSSSYFVDFNLNFGSNNLVIANNIQLDISDVDNPTILIKLYEPLPLEFDLKSQIWVVEKLSSTQSFQVEFPFTPIIPTDSTLISGPNFNLNVKNETGLAGQNFSLNDILNTTSPSSHNQLQSLLNEKGIKINVNYEDFSEFIHFSSAKTRLENFYYKVSLIEEYNNTIEELEAVNSNTTTQTSAIQNIIKNFDEYEYFLYFNSGSQYSWPKSTTSPPYTLYSTGSVEVLNWLGNADSSNPYFGGMALSASNYDQNNQDWLYWVIPEYLRNDSENDPYLLFVDMIGQHFDNIWIYIKDITNKFSADNRLDYGISKDLVAKAIKDFGVKLYSNNFNTNDLYTAFLGITPSGSLFPYPDQTNSLPTPNGYEYIDTLISSSNDIIPLDDANKRLYKRIYHNLPYLLKTKGTIAGLRALITSYGIPDTILRINEFGGNIVGSIDDRNLKQQEFNYAFNTQNTAYFSSSFIPNSNFDTGRPNTIQFRFKTDGIPSQLSQSLWSIDNGNSSLIIEYDNITTTSSYSGSIPNLYSQYGTLKLIPDSSDPSISASIYLPFFDGGWWSIMTTQDDTIATLYAANSINNSLGFNESSSITGYNSNNYNNGVKISFPNPTNLTYNSKIYTPFSGLLQEIRYYSPSLNLNSFYDFTLNPYSIEGNGINTSPNELIFRADLGTLSNIDNRNSIHPKSTGSISYITSSFSTGSSFYLSDSSFEINREIISQNQLISGIKDRVTDKIHISPNILAESPSGSNPDISILSPLKPTQQLTDISGSFSENVNYLEVAFSPQDQINNDIISQLGNFNLGEYIGDPRNLLSNSITYPDLDTLRDSYFEKYIKSYDVLDFIRLIKFFDNSLFKMIKDFTPARTSLSSGIVIKQHILERNRVKTTQLTSSNETLEGTIKPFSRGYDTGSGDTGQYEYISGSSIYRFKGETGGAFEQFSGIEFHPNALSNNLDITQSWEESSPTISGSVIYTRDDQREFYNGEFSGSNPYIRLQRGLGNSDDPCSPYIKFNPEDFYVYSLRFFSGSDSKYVLTKTTTTTTTTTTSTTTLTPTPSIFTIYYNSSTSPNLYGWDTSTLACSNTGSSLTVYTLPGYSSLLDVYIDQVSLYTDNSLTTLLDGNNTWYKTVESPNQGESFQLRNNGSISVWGIECCDCEFYDLDISSVDIEDATGNTFSPQYNNVVIVRYIDCNSIPREILVEGGYIPDAICVKINSLISITYYKDNNELAAALSSAIPTGVACCSSTTTTTTTTTTTLNPFQNTWYYGKLSRPGGVVDIPTEDDINIASGTVESTLSPFNTLSIPFNSATDDFLWFATPVNAGLKEIWFVDSLNTGLIGGPASFFGNLFPDPIQVTYNGVLLNLYISTARTNVATMLIYKDSVAF
jgi:hypothetical protein